MSIVGAFYNLIKRWNSEKNIEINQYLKSDQSSLISVVISGQSYVSVVLAMALCPSVRPSQVSVLLKQLNVGSYKSHHIIVQGL